MVPGEEIIPSSKCSIRCGNAPSMSDKEKSGLRLRFSNGIEVAAHYEEGLNTITCDYVDNKGVFSVVCGNGRLLCQSEECEIMEDHTMLLDDSTGAPEPPSTLPRKRLSFLDRFLSVWILLVMILGVLLGYFVPSLRESFDVAHVATVSLPIAFGLWFMMFPVLCKVRYETIGEFMKQHNTYHQIGFSLVVNWVIGPLLMLAIAWATLPDLPFFRNGVIMVGLARCIAMVLIWNQMAEGDPEYCAVLVAANSVLQMVLYSPLAMLFLQVVSRQYLGGSSLQLDFWTVCRSVLIFLGVPLVAAVMARYILIYSLGRRWFDSKFVPRIGWLSFLALLWTIFAMFALQGSNIINNIGSVCRVAVPMILYFAIMWTGVLLFCRWARFGYAIAVTQAFTASSNNFELAIAVAVGTFGVDSHEALAATIGPLVEVPVLLSLVYLATFLQQRLDWPTNTKKNIPLE